MKNLLALLLFIASTGSIIAQTIAEQSVSAKRVPFTDHFKHFSWLYISVFVVLIGVFVAGYLFGWDKKLFKSKASGDDNHMFI